MRRHVVAVLSAYCSHTGPIVTEVPSLVSPSPQPSPASGRGRKKRSDDYLTGALAVRWGRGRGERPRLTLGLKADAIVRAVAKRLVARLPTAAKGDRFPSRHVERTSLGVHDHKIPRNAYRTIVCHSNSSTCHGCSPLALGCGSTPTCLIALGSPGSHRLAYYTHIHSLLKVCVLSLAAQGSSSPSPRGTAV